MGSGIIARACTQAYRQALANASKTGVAHEATQTIKRGLTIGEAEARQILGVTEKSSWDEILKVCLHTSPRAGCANANSGL
jgi:import inner membrane translocase subunit TIM16